VWDWATGKERSVLKGHSGQVAWVTFSPDGGRIATATGFTLGAAQTSNEVKVWDPDTGAELLTLKAPFVTPSGMAFTSDGNRLLLAGGANPLSQSVKIWDGTPPPQK
jgi:WD40 repeat protein